MPRDSKRKIVNGVPPELITMWVQHCDAPSDEAWYHVLRALVTGRNMSRAWIEINRKADAYSLNNELDHHRHRAVEAHEVYTKAAILVRQHLKPLRKRSVEKAEALRISRAARRLSAALRNAELNQSIARWLPDDSADEIIKIIHHLPEFECPLRRALAFDPELKRGRQNFLSKQLTHMPTLSTLIDAVVMDSEGRAKNAMSAWRPIEHVGGMSQDEVRISIFVKEFAAWLRLHFGGEMHMTTASIAGAIYDCSLTKADIAGLLRHSGTRTPAKRARK